jgi:hypothetical protein
VCQKGVLESVTIAFLLKNRFYIDNCNLINNNFPFLTHQEIYRTTNILRKMLNNAFKILVNESQKKKDTS